MNKLESIVLLSQYFPNSIFPSSLQCFQMFQFEFSQRSDIDQKTIVNRFS
jgi:hypothetical protein